MSYMPPSSNKTSRHASGAPLTPQQTNSLNLQLQGTLPRTSRVLELPDLTQELHASYLRFLNLPTLFGLRRVSRFLRDTVDDYLRLYFRRGPPILSWVVRYQQRDGPIVFHVHKRSITRSPITGRDELAFEYRAYWLGQEFDRDAPPVLVPLFDLHSARPIYREGWITTRLRDIFPGELPATVYPHQQWSEYGVDLCGAPDCREECFKYGGVAVQERLQFLTNKLLRRSNPPNEYLWINYEIRDANVERWMKAEGIRAESTRARILGNFARESEKVPREMWVFGMKVTLKAIGRELLPENQHLQLWFHRVVL